MATITAVLQSTWATGDFSMVGAGHVIVGEQLCESVGVFAGDRVLDVATGSGNTALAAARRGCVVTGIDFVPELLERGRARAEAERLRVAFKYGDAEAIPFPDRSFDVVLSTFGAMFAPDPKLAAAEMLRVCRPGGRIGMANWTPEGMLGEMSRLTAVFAPLPATLPPPVLWGAPDVVRERFGSGVESLRIDRRRAAFRHHSPESWVEFMKTYFGPTIRAHERSGERAGDLTAAMVDVARRHNRAGNGTFLAYGDYVEVIALRTTA